MKQEPLSFSPFIERNPAIAAVFAHHQEAGEKPEDEAGRTAIHRTDQSQ
ncbi:MAG: hypothetical protein PHZ00_02315 [Candidatus Peribacteraceae bacterium]|nr:hypothetical protein [Candidatus Peribacteraceae bacterium]